MRVRRARRAHSALLAAVAVLYALLTSALPWLHTCESIADEHSHCAHACASAARGTPSDGPAFGDHPQSLTNDHDHSACVACWFGHQPKLSALRAGHWLRAILPAPSASPERERLPEAPYTLACLLPRGPPARLRC